MASGPIPKRSEHRVRRNKVEGLTQAPGAVGVTPPAEDKSWCLTAKRWYRALKKSGQSAFYEPSDWAFAQLACVLMTAELESGQPRAAMISEITKMMDSLLTSEGARRRARLELQRSGGGSDTGSADVVLLESYKAALGV